MAHKPFDLIYGLEDDPPLQTCLLIGLQHACVITISLVMPILVIQSAGAGNLEAASFISASLFGCGVATIIQSLNGRRVGSGYLCPVSCEASYLSASIAAAGIGGLPLVSGMTILSAAFEVSLSRAIKHLRLLFTPELTGLVVVMVSITLMPVASRSFIGADSGSAAIDLTDLLISTTTLALMVILSIWGKKTLRLCSALIGISAGYAMAYMAGVLTSDQIHQVLQMPAASLPINGLLHMSFDPSLALPFMTAGICASLKIVGNLTTSQKINDSEWIRPDMKSISRGVLSDGIGATISGIAGGMGQSISTANVGLTQGTGATSRKIAYVTGPALIALSFFPKVAGIFMIMPKPVMGAALIFALSFSLLTGLEIMMSRMIDSRKALMIGIAIVFGLSTDTMPDVYEVVHSPWISPIIGSPLSMATILALVLAIIFRIGVAKQQRLVIEPGGDLSGNIISFMEVQGALWSARKDIIRRASAALSELIESISVQSLTSEPITVDVSFDEFNLDIAVQYNGKRFYIPSSCPSEADFSSDDAAFYQLSAFMVRQYSDSIYSEYKDGQCKVFIHLDH